MNSTYLNPKVSVITPCLNSEKYLERTILSVLSQSYLNIEYIIIDGGSKDATLKIIHKYSEHIANLISEPDNGIYDAQNKGIKLATGEILCILNSDDRFYSTKVIEKIVDFFKQHKADFVYGNMLYSNLDNSEVRLIKFPEYLTKRYFLRGPLGHQATFFHKDCFIKAGYYDTHYKISADYEWYLRALFKKGLRASHINEIIVIFQEGGKSNNWDLRLSETDSVLKSYFKPSEILIGKIINLFLYGDLLRFIGKMILRRKGYNYLRSIVRKINKIKYARHLS